MMLLQCIYLMLPAYFANMAPVIVRDWFPFFKTPIDFNKKLHNKPIFGKNKTWRGLFFGVMFSIIIAFLQYNLSSIQLFSNLSIIDYSNWFVIGFLLGFGAILGDAIKSFIKRRINLKPGKRFVPWDQTDFVLGALIFFSLFEIFSWSVYVFVIIISFILHITINHIAFYLGIRKEKW